MLVYDRSRLVTDAEEGMDAGYHIPNFNPEPTITKDLITKSRGLYTFNVRISFGFLDSVN